MANQGGRQHCKPKVLADHPFNLVQELPGLPASLARRFADLIGRTGNLGAELVALM